MNKELKPLRLKFIFTNKPTIGKNPTTIVESETGRPIHGVSDGTFVVNKLGRQGVLELTDFDVEVKSNNDEHPTDG